MGCFSSLSLFTLIKAHGTLEKARNGLSYNTDPHKCTFISTYRQIHPAIHSSDTLTHINTLIDTLWTFFLSLSSSVSV